MADPLHVDLSEEQRDELIDVRDHHEKPYMREKAAAVLKVAGLLEGEGQSARQVALHGLLRERRPNTVRDWVHTYREEGIDGFLVEEGRGQKPAFSPGR
jgi:transposase